MFSSNRNDLRHMQQGNVFRNHADEKNSARLEESFLVFLQFDADRTSRHEHFGSN